MAYDGRSASPSVKVLLNDRGISIKTYKFWRKKYPNLSLRDLIDLINAKKS